MKKLNKPTKEIKLENVYKRYFERPSYLKYPVSRSLKQPSPFKNVETCVTYGACEEPI